MSIVIGSARSDERKKYSGGVRGDQRQTTIMDNTGEVSVQNFYVHSKGWEILRAKDDNVARVMGALMAVACANSKVGYSQSDRDAILKVGVHTQTPTNCDCSSLVREIVKEATHKDPGNFNTSNEATILMNTGMFERLPFYSGKTMLYVGDILVTKTKGHTAIVIYGFSRG